MQTVERVLWEGLLYVFSSSTLVLVKNSKSALSLAYLALVENYKFYVYTVTYLIYKVILIIYSLKKKFVTEFLVLKKSKSKAYIIKKLNW